MDLSLFILSFNGIILMYYWLYSRCF